MPSADLDSVKQFADRIKQEARGVDILIQTAAIAGKPYKKSPQVGKSSITRGWDAVACSCYSVGHSAEPAAATLCL